MKKIIIYSTILILFGNCRDGSNVKSHPEEPVVAASSNAQKINSTLQELLKFVDISETNVKDVADLVGFKMMDIRGNITSLDLENGAALFKSFASSENIQYRPIMEIKDSNKVLLMVKGKGFGGPIWAKLLMDATTHEILKVKFEHKAETEGYGAGITRSSFQNQFIGKTIKISNNTFALVQNGKEWIKGEQPIDGISGATVTSENVVHMLNEGLLGYAQYFQERP
jgi:Na+-transporting NADH:ubiquinone oxidoreductase subunit C